MAARSQAHLMAAERSKQNPINHRNRSLHIFNDDDVNCSLKAFHLAASPPHRPPLQHFPVSRTASFDHPNDFLSIYTQFGSANFYRKSGQTFLYFPAHFSLKFTLHYPAVICGEVQVAGHQLEV